VTRGLSGVFVRFSLPSSSQIAAITPAKITTSVISIVLAVLATVSATQNKPNGLGN
jgi:hypothetical protein